MVYFHCPLTGNIWPIVNATSVIAWQWQWPALCWIEDQRKFLSLRMEVAAESKVACNVSVHVKRILNQVVVKQEGKKYQPSVGGVEGGDIV